MLSVGRLEPRKGTDILLRAFATIVRDCSATLLLVGSGSQEQYCRLAAGLGIAERVIFTGHVDALMLRKLYAVCDTFVFPSLMEGLGLAALDAVAAGKFVVASRVGGIPEIVPADAGLLVPPGEVRPLALALLASLSVRSVGCSTVPAWADAGRQLLECYQSVCA
jgi:glycosyltransferase involved in cell wall biosynthesis